MKTIDTLADDIKGLFSAALNGDTHSFEEAVLAKFGAAMALHVADSLRARTGGRKPNTLYMSEIGKPCRRQLWYGVHFPDLAEPMLPHTLVKFMYGDLIEEMALLLAEAAGHTVERRQETVEWESGGWKVRGRMDAVIDGVLVDVKSCSSYAYKKFQEGLNDDNDSFGYRAQLNGYNKEGGRQGFLAIDKQNGHIGFFEVPFEHPIVAVDAAVAAVKSEVEPPRKFELVPEGKSGNLKLGVECSYCPYKQACWRDANHGEGLKAYAYSYGPTFLGTIHREPKVPEIKLPKLPSLAMEMLESRVTPSTIKPITGVLIASASLRHRDSA